MNPRITKRQLLTALIISVFLFSALFVNSSNAGMQASQTIQSNGVVAPVNQLNSGTKMEFLIRYAWIGSLVTAADVDAYVAEHPWGTGILLTDLSSGILSVISYTGWNETQRWQGTYGGITYAQLKEVIDEFHRLGWKVIYSPGNTPKSNDRYLYDYLVQQHPELIAVAGNGNRYDQIHPGTVMVNFFANYTTEDPARNITVGARLSDLYYQRLSQMISDGSFQWDGWFGVDGWNGFTIQGMYWLWGTAQPFGRYIGISDLSKWYYGDDQSISEWAASTYASGLPSNWTSYSSSQKINWITTNANANLQWWQYWQDRYAQFYGQINQIFDTRPSDFKVGSIISQDLSSTWADNGGNNPVGMENLTAFAQHNSFNHYYIDCEYSGKSCAQYQAYVAGLVKAKIPQAHCIAGLGVASTIPDYEWKQQYLAQIQTYAWKNGVQYRAVDPNWVLVWASTTAYWSDSQAHGQEMADWVTLIANVLDDNISPTWLGPVAVQPLFLNLWSAGPFSVNFTFAQYTDALNLNKSATNFVPAMKSIFFDAIGDYGTAIGNKGYQNLLDLYANGKINVIWSGNRYQASFANTVFMGQGNSECMNAFHLTQSYGATNTAATLSSSEVVDGYAREIIGDTFGKNYTGYAWAGSMNATSGMIPLIKYTDGPLQLGISHVNGSGRLLYGNAWGVVSTVIDDRAMLNRAIYWTANCPIKSSDALADMKVFTLSNGNIAIAIMNHRDYDQNMPLTLDLSGLALDSGRTYTARWASGSSTFDLTSLDAVQLTLTGSTDILIISAQ